MTKQFYDFSIMKYLTIFQDLMKISLKFKRHKFSKNIFAVDFQITVKTT